MKTTWDKLGGAGWCQRESNRNTTVVLILWSYMVRARAGTLHEVTACTDVVILYGNVCPAWSGCVFTNSVRTVANGVRTSPNNVRTVYEMSMNCLWTIYEQCTNTFRAFIRGCTTQSPEGGSVYRPYRLGVSVSQIRIEKEGLQQTWDQSLQMLTPVRIPSRRLTFVALGRNPTVAIEGQSSSHWWC